MTSLDEQADRLRELHHTGEPLLLPNVWDAGSARVVADAGYPAIATASAAISAMLGYSDGEGAPPEEMLAAAGRVSRAVDVPVTVDAEAGYGLPAGELVDRLLTAGAVGCNLEDTDHAAATLTSAEAQADRIAAIRAAATSAGVDLVINARTDTFVHDVADPVAEAITRARAYLAAGADCVYPILAKDAAQISRIAQAVSAPVNALCFPAGPTLRTLVEAGATRVSFGPNPYQAALTTLRTITTQISTLTDPYSR